MNCSISDSCCISFLERCGLTCATSTKMPSWCTLCKSSQNWWNNMTVCHIMPWIVFLSQVRSARQCLMIRTATTLDQDREIESNCVSMYSVHCRVMVDSRSGIYHKSTSTYRHPLLLGQCISFLLSTSRQEFLCCPHGPERDQSLSKRNTERPSTPSSWWWTAPGLPGTLSVVPCPVTWSFIINIPLLASHFILGPSSKVVFSKVFLTRCEGFSIELFGVQNNSTHTVLTDSKV